MRKSNEEKGLLAKLASSVLDGMVGDESDTYKIVEGNFTNYSKRREAVLPSMVFRTLHM